MTRNNPTIITEPLVQAVHVSAIEEPEPEHGCCVRCIMAPCSVICCVPASACLIQEFISTPLLFIAAICCKFCICNTCCPEDIHHTFRNVILTPCRYARISCTGKGHIVCWKHPAWPFRKDT